MVVVASVTVSTSLVALWSAVIIGGVAEGRSGGAL
jgi:hypothetical protein